MDEKAVIPEFLSGGGEMGRRIREYNWAATPLGPVESWPQSLRTCIRIMLDSRQPIWIGWGKDLIKLYNDPYIAIVGGKHPGALGMPASVVWKAIWREIGPMLHTVMEEDTGTYVESQLLIMERNGYPEETYYTFSYTPIPGAGGGTAGMICFNVDDTDRILSERQLQTLSRLGKSLTDCSTYSQAAERTMDALGRNGRDFPFALFYSAGETVRASAPGDSPGAGEEVRLMATTPLGASAAGVPVTFRLSDDMALAAALRQARDSRAPQVIEGLMGLLGSMPQGGWEIATDKAIVLPILEAGGAAAAGFLVIGISPYRPVDERYLNFFTLVADQLATSFADIRVLELERGRAEALAEIDRAKTLFFSNISHEFRTPLTLLLGPIEDLLSDPGSLEGNKYRLGVAYRNALRMQKLVNTLLEFSRIEAGRLEGQFRRVDIGTLTLDLASTFRSTIEKAGMKLLVNVEPIKGEVFVDIDLWERIILNLISNAFKYSHDGSISVDVREVDDRVMVSVTDTGVGIAEDQLDKIFDRFHRVENSSGRSLEGTGIGLAVVRELVKLHQGTIDVTSRVGVGSTFTVAIPMGDQHLPPDRVVRTPASAGRTRQSDAFVMEAMKWVPDEAAADDAGVDVAAGGGGVDVAAGGGGADVALGGVDAALGGAGVDVAPGGLDGHRFAHANYRVLLADDNADMREYVQRLLAPQFRVITARDGEEALEKILEYRPDLVLSDVMMPRMDGFSLLKAIRATPEIQATPVILLSARAGEEAKIEGLEAGADDYLVKPFGGRELIARVESNIRIARERAAAFRDYAEKLEQAVRKRTQDLRRLNVSLEQSNEDLMQFAHVASHDLKEPVRKVRTFAGRLLEEYGATLPEEAKKFLSKIQHATERMSMMIEGVLTYSILNSNEQTITQVDLNEVFDNIEADLEVAIERAGAEFRRDKLPTLEGAHVLLYQLFYNLVNNALKFSAEVDKPLIVIASRLTEWAGKRIAEVTVRDNGIGFDQDQSHRIFEAFARLNSKDRFEGTGLGLALCKKIAERHRGSITATSVKGQGAVFIVRLPLSQTERSI
jgi:signal transduction histidine kinase